MAHHHIFGPPCHNAPVPATDAGTGREEGSPVSCTTSPRIVIRPESASPLKAVEVKRYGASGRRLQTTDLVQSEDVLTICVNGRIVASLTCSADHPEELVAGHLLTSGIITPGTAPESLTITIAAPTADVRIAGLQPAAPAQADAPLHITTSHARLVAGVSRPVKPFAPTPWTAASVLSLAAEFAKDRTSHARTRGCHSAYLSDGERVLCVREDVGRHNAVDKVVGWAFLEGVDLGACMLYTSGRVPTDMVFKAIRAGIPVLVSKSVTTDKAIALARSAGLVLVCEARPDAFALVSGNEPVPGELAVAI